MHLSTQTIDELYVEVIRLVLKYGSLRRPRGFECTSIGPTMFTLQNPRARVLWNQVRMAKRHFMAGEFTWIITGQRDLEQIVYYNPQMTKFSDDGKTLFGAYGPHIAKQLPYVINALLQDPDSRQAVLTLWQPCPPKTKDVPCTISMQFRIVNGHVEMTTFMRSNDIWLGLPYDIFTFTAIQEVVATCVGLDVGPYHHVVGDLHLYKMHEGHARRALEDRADSEIMPKLAIGNLSDLQDQLAAWDRMVRGLKNVTMASSKDPFIGWMQQRMLERKTNDNPTGKDHRNQGAGGTVPTQGIDR